MGIKIADTSGQDIVRERTPRARWWRIGWPLAVVALVIAVAVPLFSQWSQAETSVPRERLRLAIVTQGDLTRDVSIQGRVVAAVSPTLYSPAQGTITYHVDAGDQVEQGQLLVSVESPELESQLEQENASLESAVVALERQQIQVRKDELEARKAVDMARVTLTAAEREKRRADLAWENNAISQIDYEKAQDDLENARLVYNHAVADADLNSDALAFELQTRQLEVSRQQSLVTDLQRQVLALNIISPVSGIVGNRELDQKNQVAKNQSVLSVVDLTAFEVEMAIPESYADSLAIGMDAEITYNGVVHPANLVAISPEIRDNQVVGNVRFADTMPSSLRQNQRLTTRILLDHKPNVLTLRRGQFLESGGGRIAYVVRDGVAERTTIEIGATSMSAVEIVSGLAVGDEVIVSSIEPFGEASTVRLTD